MQFQPTPCDGRTEAGAVFRGRALVAEQERAVDPLDIDPALLNGLKGACMFQPAARRLLRVGVGAIGGVFYPADCRGG